MAVDQEDSPAPGRRPLRGKITAPGGAVGHRTARSPSFLNPVNPKRARNCPRHLPLAGPKKMKKITQGFASSQWLPGRNVSCA